MTTGHRPLKAALEAAWLAKGWPLSDLASFRMEGDGSGGAGTGAGAGTAGAGAGTGAGAGAGTGSGGDAGGAPTVDQLQADLDKWKGHSRSWEDRAKANAKAAEELEALKKSAMTDQEKAVNEAKEAGRAEATQGMAASLALAKIEAALAGRMDKAQIDALVGAVDGSKFLTDKHEVDADKVKAYADGVAPAGTNGNGAGGNRKVDLGQGRREQGKPSAAEIGREKARQRFGDPANAAK